jgi:hypothetical protein
MNSNLSKAKKSKNDEFYTQLKDIEAELQHYTDHFKGKVVYCNCDTKDSKFVEYFETLADYLQIKDLYFSSQDFRSDISIELLKQSDIVVTNPPFSLFREYVAQLIEYDKKFLIIGNNNAITYKEVFKLIKEGNLWLGMNPVKEFVRPDNTIQKFGNICWFTNLEHNKRNEEIILYKTYNASDYPKYDNYDAIEVSKVKEIPIDYDGYMGVPITFLDKYNPNQFEIITGINGGSKRCDTLGNELSTNNTFITGINGKPKYYRIIIKRKQS